VTSRGKNCLTFGIVKIHSPPDSIDILVFSRSNTNGGALDIREVLTCCVCLSSVVCLSMTHAYVLWLNNML